MAKPVLKKLFGPMKPTSSLGLKKPKRPRAAGQLDAEKQMDEKVLRQSDPEIADLKKLTPMEKYHQKRMKKMGM